MAQRTDRIEAAAEHPRVMPGMPVFGLHSVRIGMVKELGKDAFLVSRLFQRDIWVPYSAILNAGTFEITLRIPAEQADQMDWESPPV